VYVPNISIGPRDVGPLVNDMAGSLRGGPQAKGEVQRRNFGVGCFDPHEAVRSAKLVTYAVSAIAL
jgi:hypothetical protein